MKKLLHLRLHLAALAAAGLLLHAGSAHAQTPPPSPVGTWDFSITGNQVGLALLTFEADFTFHGVQYLRPGPVKNTSTSTPDPRYPAGVPTRSGPVPIPSSPQPPTNFIGSTEMTGAWAYEGGGKVIGMLDQVTESIQLVEKTVTNAVTTTTIVGGITVVTTEDVVSTTNVFESVRATNAVSFRASVVPGKRLTFVSYLPRGRNTYSGLPAIALPDISGDYFASGKRGKLPYIEFLTLTPNPATPGEYVVTGAGAGYSFAGFALPSRRNQIAVFMQTDREPFPITVLTGAFNLTTRRGSLIGRDTSGNRHTYRLVHQ